MDDELEGIWKKVVVVQSRYNAGICLEGMRKTMKNPARMAGVQDKIQTENLPNTNLQRYCYANPLDNINLHQTCHGSIMQLWSSVC
jgi:hypothetical protein